MTSAQRPRGRGAASARRRLGTGASRVLFRGSSFRASERSQPFWTKVSLPSGRTSDTVTCRSTLGAEDRIHARSAPTKTTAVSEERGADTYDPALPAGLWSQRYCGNAVQSPPGPELV